MERCYRQLHPNMGDKEVYLGDYLETAIKYTQRHVDKALENESIDKNDEMAMPYWTEDVKLVPVECPDHSLDAVTLHTKVKFNRKAVINLLGYPGEDLHGLHKKFVTRLIMERIITFAMTVLSLEETYEVGSSVWGGWPYPRFRCSEQDPRARGDIALKDKGEVFGVVDMKSPNVGAGSQWKSTVEMLQSGDPRVTWLAQAGEAALVLVKSLRGKSALEQKQKPDPKHDNLPDRGVGEVDENEVATMLLPGGGEMLPKVPMEDGRIECPGFHAAVSVFPSHLFVGVVKEDGSFCITNDLMLDLWQAKGPKSVSELLHDEDWVRAYINRLWGWTLVTLCTRRSNLKAFWAENSPDQIDNIRLYLKNVGEASIPASPWSVVTQAITGVCTWLVQGISSVLSALGLLQPVLLLAHPLVERLTQAWAQHQVCRLKKYHWISMVDHEGYVLELNNNEYARTEECWTLPPADKCFTSSTALTFIYANPPIVVKIFLEPDCYEQERKAYEKLALLSCSKSFPVLHASGRAVDNEQSFLIFSNEGERVDAVTESDKRALEPIIEQMHSAGVWHNDLHARNVLRNRKGELRIIDFGAASFHDRGGDSWQPNDFTE